MTEQHGKSSEEPGVAAPEPVLPQGIFAQAQAIAVNADRPSALNMDTKEDSGSETVQPTPNTDEDRSQTFHESGPAPLRNLHLEIPIEQVPPPAYSEAYGHVDLDQDGMDTQARLASTIVSLRRGDCSVLLTISRRWSSKHKYQPEVPQAF